MNRIDFMARLSLLLSDLPESERAEAVQYYEDYLNDAGVENEEEVLRSLGTPEELAASIREGLKEGNEQQGEFSEKGFFENGTRLENEMVRREEKARGASERESAGGSFTYGNASYSAQRQSSAARGAQSRNAADGSLDRRYRGRQKKKGMSGGMIALLVILGILAAPVVIPVVFTLAVVVVVLAFVAVLLAGIFLFVGVICVVAGVIAFAGSVAKLFVYPAGATMVIGISLLTIGVGILLTIAIGWIVSKVFPKAFNGLVDLVGGMFHKKGGNEA